MAYTVGAGTGDDINFPSTTSALVSNSTWAVAGWVCPTTLTAGRTLFSAGSAANCAVIGATTSELELLTDCSTTDGKWTTSGLGLTVNVWRFIAVLISVHDTGPLMTCRVWAATIQTPPVEISASQTTAPAGTFSGSPTWFIGNKGTGVLAFQGPIDNVDMMHGVGVGTNATLLIPAAHGVIDQTEADRFRDLYVIPLWFGDHHVITRGRGALTQATTAKWHIELAGDGYGMGHGQTAVTPEAALTINGATVAQDRGPRPPISRPGWPLRRR